MRKKKKKNLCQFYNCSERPEQKKRYIHTSSRDSLPTEKKNEIFQRLSVDFPYLRLPACCRSSLFSNPILGQMFSKVGLKATKKSRHITHIHYPTRFVHICTYVVSDFLEPWKRPLKITLAKIGRKDPKILEKRKKATHLRKNWQKHSDLAVLVEFAAFAEIAKKNLSLKTDKLKNSRLDAADAWGLSEQGRWALHLDNTHRSNNALCHGPVALLFIYFFEISYGTTRPHRCVFFLQNCIISSVGRKQKKQKSFCHFECFTSVSPLFFTGQKTRTEN